MVPPSVVLDQSMRAAVVDTGPLITGVGAESPAWSDTRPGALGWSGNRLVIVAVVVEPAALAGFLAIGPVAALTALAVLVADALHKRSRSRRRTRVGRAVGQASGGSGRPLTSSVIARTGHVLPPANRAGRATWRAPASVVTKLVRMSAHEDAPTRRGGVDLEHAVRKTMLCSMTA
jgi:hypothetical protein